MNSYVWLKSPNYTLTKSNIPLGYVYKRGNPDIAAFTLRFKFASDVYSSSSDAPPLPVFISDRTTTKGSWTKVQGVVDNLWDYTYENPDWSSLFYSLEDNRTDVNYGFGDYWTTPCEIVDSGDLTGVTRMNNAFVTITNLASVNIPSIVAVNYAIANATPPFSGLAHLKHVTINYVKGSAHWFFRQCSELETVHIGYLYDPHTSGTISAEEMCAYCYALTDFDVNFVKPLQSLGDMFYACRSLVHAPVIDTSSATSMDSMFRYCSSMIDAPAYDLSNHPSTQYMFSDCSSLEYAPAFDTSTKRSFKGMFMHCTSLKEVPLYDTSSAVNMDSTFSDCPNVEGGSFALYQQASSQAVPPTTHKLCFKNCGSNTVTGAAELALIPDDWKGSGT